jgi:peptidoglycan/LPS O-acetylase OafA/YrhL
MKYSKSLDGLRGIAILAVMLFHYDFVLGIGWAGVQLFFVLSGYLITTILLQEKNNSLSFYLKRFYWRRTLRIFPLYYAYLLFVGVVFIVGKIPPDYLDLFPYLATYTFNFYPLINAYSYQDFFFTHFWSLSVEEQFYLFWPLIIFFCNRNQLKFVLLSFILIAPLTRYLLAEVISSNSIPDYYIGQIVYRFTLAQWDGFAFGALIPVFSLTSKNINVKRLLLVSTIFVFVAGYLNRLNLSNENIDIPISTLGYQIAELYNYQHVWSYTLLNFLFFSVILYVTNTGQINSSVSKFLLENKPMVFIGKISYGLYVYHWIIWMAFNKYLKAWMPNSWIGFSVFFAICLAVSTVSYLVLEQPILSLKNRFFNIKNEQ